MKFDEVKTVFCKTGRPEIASDVMGVHQTDVWIMLKPESEWPRHKSRDELSEEIVKTLEENVSGGIFGISMPIKMRVDELVAGVKADVAVLIYGDDLELLARKGKEIERVLHEIPGADSPKANLQGNLATLSVYVKPDRLARYGITSRQVMDAVATFGGRHCGQVFEGRARYPIVVRLPEAWRQHIDLLEHVPVCKVGGTQIPPRRAGGHFGSRRNASQYPSTRRPAAERSSRPMWSAGGSPALSPRPARPSARKSTCRA